MQSSFCRLRTLQAKEAEAKTKLGTKLCIRQRRQHGWWLAVLQSGTSAVGRRVGRLSPALIEPDNPGKIREKEKAIRFLPFLNTTCHWITLVNKEFGLLNYSHSQLVKYRPQCPTLQTMTHNSPVSEVTWQNQLNLCWQESWAAAYV